MIKKDRVELICSVAELASLFDRTANLSELLQNVVGLVAYHMHAAVCSIYLLDEASNELVLQANQGLSHDAIGSVRLALGEGLVGVAVKELRPIREAHGPDSPFFKLFPGIGEEQYESFLVVPILRGFTRIGALSVQDPQRDYFDDNDTRALQAIAAQLATTIESAKLLINLHTPPPLPAPVPAPDQPATDAESFYKAAAASGGVASGEVAHFGRGATELLADDPAIPVDGGEAAFAAAMERTERQLEDLQADMEARLSDVASLIFSAHLLMLKDGAFSGAMRERIAGGMAPGAAIVEIVNMYINLFAASQNPRLREKVQDVKDLGRRLLHNLDARPETSVDYAGQVVIAAELLPSDILKLAAQHAGGLILVGGTLSSHIAVLARSMDIPVVLVDRRALLDVPEGTPVLVDAEQGNIILRPSDEVRAQVDTALAAREAARGAVDGFAGPCTTRDGTRIAVMANINLLSELPLARRLCVDGIGLYRSEFPFIVRDNFPSEEEQYRIYRAILEQMAPDDVTLRTLDMGGDKMLSYFPNVNEANPFLGLRAIRFSLRYKDIFHRQLRAMLRAGDGFPLRIMFPLVSSVDEFCQAREEVRDCARCLREEGVAHHAEPALGVMIELPSAVEIADELAQESDFLSIGANDLVQYMLAVDRTNDQINDLYAPHHPAVLRALARIVSAAVRHGKPLSFCGDMAGEPRFLPFLVGIGIRCFSVAPQRVSAVRACIAGLDCGDAAARAQKMLSMARVSEIAAFLDGA